MRSPTRRSGGGPARRPGRRPWAAVARFHREERAQVVFVVVLFFFLLAGLVFLVLNTGQKLNQKVQMQHAADSVAATGAAWYARGLNVIAMCNVADTQLLSLIVLLDTLETVVPPATECIDDLCSHIGASAAGQDMPIDSRISDWLAVGSARDEQHIIQRFGQIVAEVNWPEYLQYDNGVLWECTKLMDGFKNAMRDVTAEAAQREAMDIAEQNGAEFGFVLPLWPDLPVEKGEFEDFENPMRNGRMPPEGGERPDRAPVIGGFAHVMHYRGYYPDYDPDDPWHGPVLGPWSYWREPFTYTLPMGLLDVSRFSILFNLVSERKLEMMFGDGDNRVSLRNWEMDYDRAKELPPGDIRRAWWDRINFDARYEFPEPEFFNRMDLRHRHVPVVRTRYYGDMDRPSLTGYTRARQNYEGTCPRLAVFYKADERKTAHYPQIGIIGPHPPYHPDGSRWPYTAAEMQTYYRVTVYRFNGAELDTDESLHSRYLPPAGAEPCYPILFDRTEGDHTWDTINTRFTFNGFAYVPGHVRDWGARFRNPNPIEKVIGYAQARVYARYSWDLFTQHWRVKLMRTDRWKYLLNQAQGGVPAGAGDVAAELTQERIDPVVRLIQYYNEDFVREFTH